MYTPHDLVELALEEQARLEEALSNGNQQQALGAQSRLSDIYLELEILVPEASERHQLLQS